VLSSLSKRWGPGRPDTGYAPPAVGPADMPLITVVRLMVLLLVLVTVPLSKPHPGVGRDGVLVAVALGTVTITWVISMVAGNRFRLMTWTLVVMGAAAGVLAGVSSVSPAIAAGCVVTASAGVRLSPRISFAVTAETVTAFVITGLATGAPASALTGYSALLVGLWAFGLTRRAFVLRAEDAERALAQTRRALEAETQAAALAERARIAREIHDVLAHSLAAVSVNLQAAEGLLGEIEDDSPELAKAIECVARAGTFTREGMTEARRAITALRDNESHPPPAPLADQLAALAAKHRADGDAEVEFSVAGTPRPVSAALGLAVYRTAQEALTNARKHAPGQPVGISLEFRPAEIAVQVTNPLPPVGSARPLAGAGAGYGLTGLRERAALAGGTLTAGPADAQWRVCLTIPG
jgi:signal transduction histidine kinase